MAVSVVQTALIGGANWAGSFGSNVTAGNTVFLVVTGYNTSNVTITSSAPTFGGSPVTGAAKVLERAHAYDGVVTDYVAVWMLPAVAGGSAAVAVTVTNSQNIAPVGIIAYEVAGLGASPVTDQTVAADAAGASVSAGPTGPIAQAPEFVLGACVQDGSMSGAASSPWTNVNFTGNANSASSYQLPVASGGTYTYSATLSGTSRWAAGVVTVSPPAGAALPANQPQPGSPYWRQRQQHRQALIERAGPPPLNAAQVLAVCAHQDDDLLFLSPDLMNDVRAGKSVRCVWLTAGDAGNGRTQMAAREAASQAAWASMAGAPNTWHAGTVTVNGHSLARYTHASVPLDLVFFRLPDGNVQGQGWPASGGVSMQQLLEGVTGSLSPLDGSPSYTLADLQATLAAVAVATAPSQARIQDYAGDWGDSDHSDHHCAGWLAYFACQAASVPAVQGYLDYQPFNSSYPTNVSGADLTNKTAALAAYAAVDPLNDPTQFLPYQYQAAPQQAFPYAGIGVVQSAKGHVSGSSLVLAPHAATTGTGAQGTPGNGSLIIAGRCTTTGAADALPANVTDTAGNTWSFSSSIAQNPPSDTLTPGSHSGAFIAWCVQAKSVTSVTVSFPPSVSYAQASLTEWSGVAQEVTGATIENDAAAAAIVAPAVPFIAGDLAVAVAYPAAGTSPLGTRPGEQAGTGPVSGLVSIGAVNPGVPSQSDAGNWPLAQVMTSAGTLSWAWGVTAASVQAAAVFRGPTVPGVAAITGAGSVAAPVVQVTTVPAIAGAGSLTANVTLDVTATLTGAGTVAAAVTQDATAALTGAGVMAASSGGSVGGTGTLTGTGAVTAAGVITGAGALAGAGALTGAVTLGAGAQPQAAGAIIAVVTQDAAAILAAAGALQAGQPTVPAKSISAVTDPRDGTPSVTARATSMSGVS